MEERWKNTACGVTPPSWIFLQLETARLENSRLYLTLVWKHQGPESPPWAGVTKEVEVGSSQPTQPDHHPSDKSNRNFEIPFDAKKSWVWRALGARVNQGQFVWGRVEQSRASQRTWEPQENGIRKSKGEREKREERRKKRILYLESATWQAEASAIFREGKLAPNGSELCPREADDVKADKRVLGQMKWGGKAKADHVSPIYVVMFYQFTKNCCFRKFISTNRLQLRAVFRGQRHFRNFLEQNSPLGKMQSTAS